MLVWKGCIPRRDGSEKKTFILILQNSFYFQLNNFSDYHNYFLYASNSFLYFQIAFFKSS